MITVKQYSEERLLRGQDIHDARNVASRLDITYVLDYENAAKA